MQQELVSNNIYKVLKTKCLYSVVMKCYILCVNLLLNVCIYAVVSTVKQLHSSLRCWQLDLLRVLHLSL